MTTDNTQFKIDKGIKIPSASNSKIDYHGLYLPMEIGDSVFIESKRKGSTIACKLRKLFPDRKFVVREWTEQQIAGASLVVGEKEGQRIWRTA